MHLQGWSAGEFRYSLVKNMYLMNQIVTKLKLIKDIFNKMIFRRCFVIYRYLYEPQAIETLETRKAN